MPAIDKPPVSPSVQAQMGPPGGPAFGPGVAQAQDQMEKSPIETAVSTCEKILMGISDEAFRPYAMKAIASLKVGAAMVAKKSPTSAPPGASPMAKSATMPTPPMAGQMAG